MKINFEAKSNFASPTKKSLVLLVISTLDNNLNLDSSFKRGNPANGLSRNGGNLRNGFVSQSVISNQ